MLAMMDIPGAIRQFPAEVRLSVKGIETGADQGLISFVEGGLFFQGRRMSFVLQAIDVNPFLDVNILVPPFGFSPTAKVNAYKIGWRADRLEGIIALHLFGETNGAKKEHLQEFRSLYQDWLRIRPGEAQTILPPVEPQPGFSTDFTGRLTFWRTLTAVSIGSAILCLILMFEIPVFAALAAPLPLVGIGCGLVTANLQKRQRALEARAQP